VFLWRKYLISKRFYPERVWAEIVIGCVSPVTLHGLKSTFRRFKNGFSLLEIPTRFAPGAVGLFPKNSFADLFQVFDAWVFGATDILVSHESSSSLSIVYYIPISKVAKTANTTTAAMRMQSNIMVASRLWGGHQCRAGSI
jgi:hypothetical protein